MPGLLEMPTQVSLVYAERELQRPQVRAFVDAVVAWALGAFAELPASCPPRGRARR